VEESEQLWAAIAAELTRLRNGMGLCVLFDPQTCDANNMLHMAIYTMRHNPAAILQMTSVQLSVYGAVLAAGQAYAHSLGMEWQARYVYLGKEIERLMRDHREAYKGDTVAAKEAEVLKHEPPMKKLRNEFLRAQAIATFLTDAGKHFAQLEDGLKRGTDGRAREEGRMPQQQKWASA
jgi:hypothetical protein